MTIAANLSLIAGKLISITTALLAFSSLIVVHEFGHFIFCKIFGIRTPTFSIGIGPELYSRQIGQTKFRIGAIPVAGYVEIAGLEEVGQGKQEFAESAAPDSFKSKNFFQKALIILGGIIFNIIYGYIAISLAFSIGLPKQKFSVEISNVKDSKLAEEVLGFSPHKGDILSGINGEAIATGNYEKLEKQLKELEFKNGVVEVEFARPNHSEAEKKKTNETDSSGVKQEKGKATKVDVEKLSAEIAESKIKEITSKEQSDKETSKEQKKQTIGQLMKAIGIELSVSAVMDKNEKIKFGFFRSLHEGFKKTIEIITRTAEAIVNLFTKRSLRGAAGPVMIVAKTVETAQHGLAPLLFLLAIISINLALANLLPIEIFDGGQLLFISIEAIIRRELPNVVKMSINIASLIAVAALFIYITFNDIKALITGWY